ncbi:zinc finger, CCHC-type containing protein [Tanacetum coccineum]
MAGNTVKDMTTNFGKLEKFEGHDFRRWQKKMHFLLTILKVVYVLTTPMPVLMEDATVEAIRICAKWENDDYICRGHILNGMPDSLFDVYTNVESAKELWDSLKSKYMAEDSSSKKFLDFKHTLKHSKDDLSLVQLGSHLRIEESLRAQDSNKGKGKEVDGPSVNMTEEGKSKNNKQNKGKKRGFKENNNGSGSNKKSKLECWKCGMTGHFKRDCRSGNKKNANAGGSGKGSKNHSQDQGKNLVHVWNSLVKYFVSLISEAFYMQVDAIAWWINSGATTNVCKDRCSFNTFKPVEDESVLYMGDDHFAPVHGKGIVLEFSSGKSITLFNVLYVPKLRFGYYNNGMFMLNLNKVSDDSDSVYMSSSSTVVNSSLWHARLGHVHYKRMLEMSKNDLIPAIDENHDKCNKKYVITFIDDASRFCYEYLLHAKDEALNKFRIYKTEESFMKLQPQQNGVAERKNKALKEMVNSMVPNKSNNTTTYELWYKKRPNLSYLRVWGCRAVVRLPDPKRKTLGEKGIDCIFVGYVEHSKAYRFYVIEPNESVSINSIIESRNVIFDENRFSLISRPKDIMPNLEESQRDDHSNDVPNEILEPRKDPRTYNEAIQSHDAAFWKEEIDDEIGSIMKNDTWVLSDLPPGCKPLGCKWIFKRKMKVDGTINKFKARLVIQGFIQKEGINYFDTYAAVARITTIRLLLALEAIHNLVIHQMDVKTTFLNGDLDEEVYIKQPEGFVMPDNEHKIKREDKGIVITQSHYIKKILKNFNREDCSPVSTPIDPVEKLKPNTWKHVDQLEYLRAIGCLMYAMKSTRPDIAYAVGRLSRFTSNPSRQHWKAITRVFKYLRGTKDYGLSYVGYPSVLEAYSDASWINYVEDSSSTSGWVFLLEGEAISWASKKQTCITGSTMESEFVELPAVGKEAERLRNLIYEIPIWPKPIAPISIRCDSKPTMAKVVLGDGFTTITGNWRDVLGDFIMVNVYTPQNGHEKSKLWSNLLHLKNIKLGFWICFGDFNVVREESERKGTEFDPNKTYSFNKFIDDAELQEVVMGARKFTRINKKWKKLSKLDKVLISSEGCGEDRAFGPGGFTFSPSKEFKLRKGLRQGDPMSPFLFIIAMEAFHIAMMEAREKRVFKGVEVGKNKVKISHLQYVDDALLVGEWSEKNIMNLIRILRCFQVSSRLKVNLSKSCLMGVGVKNGVVKKSNKLSICLSRFEGSFFGMVGSKKKKFHGLRGIKLLPLLNREVLGYDLLKLLILAFFLNGCGNALWYHTLHSIHGLNGGDFLNYTFIVTKGTWYDILKAFHDVNSHNIPLSSFFTRFIGEGVLIKFWDEEWLGAFKLADVYPRLYVLESMKDCNISDRLFKSSEHLSSTWNWHRPIRNGREKEEMESLACLLEGVELKSVRDGWCWSLESSRKFSVKSLLVKLDEKLYPYLKRKQDGIL